MMVAFIPDRPWPRSDTEQGVIDGARALSSCVFFCGFWVQSLRVGVSTENQPAMMLVFSFGVGCTVVLVFGFFGSHEAASGPALFLHFATTGFPEAFLHQNPYHKPTFFFTQFFFSFLSSFGDERPSFVAI